MESEPTMSKFVALRGVEYGAVRGSGAYFKLSNGNFLRPEHEDITAGRRIWPEA